MPRRVKEHEIVSPDEIAAAFAQPPWGGYAPIVAPEQLAEITGRSRSTIYQWIQQGRLDGALRRRGKGILIWRDKAISLLFNGPDWGPDGDNRDDKRS
jgi:predicted DNA-binding transcriptional regulator AlpA